MPLELKNVSYIYQPNTPNESTALNNVSLTINDGEFIGIIGHTGSGKSTLVQLLCGLLAPTSGQVFIDGVDINAKEYPQSGTQKAPSPSRHGFSIPRASIIRRNGHRRYRFRSEKFRICRKRSARSGEIRHENRRTVR